VKPLVVATLDKFSAEAAKRAAALPNSPELIRSAQTQLARLGCFSDKVDGVMSDKTQTALGHYLSIKAEPSGDGTVTEGLVSELTSQTDRVCPLECKAGQMAKGETCVAVAKPSEPATASRHKNDADEVAPARRTPAKRQAEREQPPRTAKPAQEAPRARQEAVAPNGGGGGGNSRPMIGVGF
jgi:peptidoglycan hydrolase-like protein with peptidoglycan-binding domain